MTNIIFSIWTTPLNQGRWEITDQLKYTLLYCAISSTFAKKYGCHTVMHCDSNVYDYLKKLPYDEVHCDLDNLGSAIKHTKPTNMWAASKQYCFEQHGTGWVHIDNDVILGSEELVNILGNYKEDCIFQQVEIAQYTEKKMLKDQITTFDLMAYDYAACVGILGFNNKELLDDYVGHYKYWMENLRLETDSKYIASDLILEQLYLYSRLDKYTGLPLIGDASTMELAEICERATKLKYEHVIGQLKYQPQVLRKIEKRLMKENEKVYNIWKGI